MNCPIDDCQACLTCTAYIPVRHSLDCLLVAACPKLKLDTDLPTSSDGMKLDGSV